MLATDIHNVCVEYLCVLLNDVLGAWAHKHVEVEDATDHPVRERRSTREAVLWNTHIENKSFIVYKWSYKCDKAKMYFNFTNVHTNVMKLKCISIL